jgi:uracil-DNA glycosylase family 4
VQETDQTTIEAKERQLRQLWNELVQAAASEVCDSGRRLVPGQGNPDARLVLVGEAPGGHEERVGQPFVGPAGRVLSEALATASLSRDDVWITNVVKCRPVTEGLGGRLKNRAPTSDEVNHFLPWLLRELQVIAPKAIVAIGGTAASALLGRTVRLTRERGEWFSGPNGIPTLATYHPAYLLRRFGDREQRYGEFVADLRLAAARAEADGNHDSR